MQMHPVRDKNHQLLAVGYEPVDGVLSVQFAKGQGEHRGVPEEVFIKLCRALYPYRQYKLTVQGKYPYTRIERENDGKLAEIDKRERESCATITRLSVSNQEPDEDLQGVGNRSRAAGHERDSSRQDRQAGTGRKIDMEVFRPEDGMAFVETDPNGKLCHYYTLKGERIPFSLTQILELSGLARVPTEPSEIAARPAKAKLGTKVHEYTLWSDQGELDMEDLKPYPAYYNRVLGWQQFREDFHFEPDLTSCEIPIGVRLNGMLYAMKLDKYGCIGEGDKLAMAVVEVKCSVSLEASYALQTAGQAIAFKDHAESVQLPLKRFVVQLFDKVNGAGRFYKCIEHTDRMDEKLFIGAGLMNIYWRFNNGLLKGNNGN